MKYIYLFIGSVCAIVILIIFFQSLIWAQTPVPFLSKSRGIDLSTFVVVSSIISAVCGICFTLGIKGLFNNYSDQNDRFDL
jgi:undecaprenyl pyrophosphate phosphatase UppP